MDWKLITAYVLVLLLVVGCAPVVEFYQETIHGTTFQPGTPCTTAQVWDGTVCRGKPGGAS